MKKILLALLMSLIATTTFAQSSSVEVKVGELGKRIDSLVLKIDALSQRLVEVEQLNIRLRKALDFGKPITTIEGKSGVSYRLLALEGDKKEKTLTVRMQVCTNNESNKLSLLPYDQSIVDINGVRYEAQQSEIGNNYELVIYKDVPVNGSITFFDVDSDKVTDVKLLNVRASLGFGSYDDLLFKNLKIDWK